MSPEVIIQVVISILLAGLMSFVAVAVRAITKNRELTISVVGVSVIVVGVVYSTLVEIAIKALM
ncbi:MAG: hypothetical protein ACRCXB_04305 [Aeromonadaceae bacterium]